MKTPLILFKRTKGVTFGLPTVMLTENEALTCLRFQIYCILDALFFNCCFLLLILCGILISVYP